MSLTIAMIGQKGLPARSGGIERHVALVSAGLVRRGYRVIVYGRRWYVGDGKAPEGVEQRFTRGIRTKHLDAITHSISALWDARTLHPDVIHIQGSSVALLAPLARIFHPRAKLVVTFHCRDAEHAKWNRLAKFFLRVGESLACYIPHRTITVSQALLRDCLERFGCQAVYISHPFELASAPKEDALKEHSLTPEKYLLFVGRLIPHKQAHLLVKAYARAREQRPELFNDLPLVIVGGGAWTDNYVKWLYRLGASIPGVRFLGERFGSELRTLQAHATAHVFPTLSEGLALAMLEAGSYARPAIMTGLPQNREALGHQTLEVKMNDEQDLARALIQMASLSLDERRAMGQASYEHVKRVFDVEDRIDDMDILYREVVGRSTVLTTPYFESILAA